MLRRAGTVLAVVLTALLALLLLWPQGDVVQRALLDIYLFFLHRGVPTWVTPEVWANALNVVVFVPVAALGVLLLRRRPLHVAGVLVLASAGVELVQFLLDREPSVLDVLCNGAGAFIGAGLGSLLRRDARPEQAVEEAGDVEEDRLG
ncbi:VanZ family protein [Phycicoccus avicenniae]|uniref:VanZ family protein n=1 Tax=Phycicoccus avicenniae TaxID=2828860 RepID=UPI003D2BC9C3